MSETPANGTIIETTTRRRSIPAAKSGPPPNVWEYLAALSQQDWANHIIYVYRDDPPPSIQVAKCSTPVLEGTNAPWSDQEEMEAAFAQRFGGGQYRLMVKRGSERVCYAKLVVPGAYKNLMPRAPEAPNGYATGPQVYAMGNNQYGNPNDPTARVAETAIHTMANQEKQAVEIGISALAQAANVIKNFTPGPAPQDELTKQIMAVLIQRALAPPPDPLELMAKLLTLQGQINPAGGSVPPMMQKVLDVAIEKVLNPAPVSTGPAVSMGAELIRQLPSIAGYVTQGMADYARIMEAQRDAIAMQRGATPGQVVQPPQRPPQPQPLPPAQFTPAPQPVNGVSMLTDPMSFIEQKIVEILNEPQSAEWAAEETLNFLDRMDRSIVPQLCKQGEQGLMALFQQRPTLKPALNNPARLSEFIRAFLHYASEDSAAPANETKSN